MPATREDITAWLHDVIDEDQMNSVKEFFDGIDADRTASEEYREGAEARMAEYQEQVDSLASDNSNLKARNYDLLMQVPADEGGTGDGAVFDKVEDDGEIIHIDNLFVDKDRNTEEVNGNA